MIEFFRKLFGQPGSSTAAKERLRLVLMSDHLSLAPEMVDKMKADLVEVISRYVQVDLHKIEVNFEQQDSFLAMLANIPILSVNRQNEVDQPHVEASAEKAKPESAEGNGASGNGTPRKRRRRTKRPQMNGPAEAVSP